MRNVELTQWNFDGSEHLTNCKLWAFPDSETIGKMQVSTDSDFALALKDVAGTLYDHKKRVIATKRNQNNDGWLALCEINTD